MYKIKVDAESKKIDVLCSILNKAFQYIKIQLDSEA